MNNMDFKKFEEVIKGIDKKKYHVGRTIAFDENNNPYISQWDIFRKDMSTEEYFSPENLAILSSRNNNTLEDIEEFIRSQNNG